MAPREETGGHPTENFSTESTQSTSGVGSPGCCLCGGDVGISPVKIACVTHFPTSVQ